MGDVRVFVLVLIIPAIQPVASLAIEVAKPVPEQISVLSKVVGDSTVDEEFVQLNGQAWNIDLTLRYRRIG